LPRADRAGNRPPRAASRRSPADGHPRSHRNSRRLSDVRPRSATLSRRRVGAAARSRDQEIHEADGVGRGWGRGGSGAAAGAGKKALISGGAGGWTGETPVPTLVVELRLAGPNPLHTIC